MLLETAPTMPETPTAEARVVPTADEAVVIRLPLLTVPVVAGVPVSVPLLMVTPAAVAGGGVMTSAHRTAVRDAHDFRSSM